MASFLDNSGDIILDAVLTDYGRQLLAKGDGSFNVVKFAFGDDEIDYSLYETGAASPNQDTTLMSTPILEAFTNNTAALKNKLLTIKQENLLFLPVLKVNNSIAGSLSGSLSDFNNQFSGFVIPVDVTSERETSQALKASNGSYKDGVLAEPSRFITTDQGLDSSKLDGSKSLVEVYPELNETEYNIYIDSRLGFITGLQNPVSVDDDLIATYKVTTQLDGAFVQQIGTDTASRQTSPIAGTKGTRIKFSISPRTDLAVTDIYFATLGNLAIELVSGTTFKTIRSTVTIEGVNTGVSIDIPIMFAKKN